MGWGAAAAALGEKPSWTLSFCQRSRVGSVPFCRWTAEAQGAEGIPRMSQLTLHAAHGRTFSRGALQQFSRERGCILMPPTEKSNRTSGKPIPFQRTCRGCKSKIFQEEPPHLEAALQWLGDSWREIKCSSDGGRGAKKEIREEWTPQEKASSGLLRGLTITHRMSQGSTLSVSPSWAPDWLFDADCSGEHPVCARPHTRLPCHQPSRNAGAALLTRVELGWAGQGPGGGQGGLGAQ